MIIPSSIGSAAPACSWFKARKSRPTMGQGCQGGLKQSFLGELSTKQCGFYKKNMVIEPSKIGSNNKHWDLTNAHMQTWEFSHLTWDLTITTGYLNDLGPEMGHGTYGHSWGTSIFEIPVFGLWWLSRCPKIWRQAVRGEVGNYPHVNVYPLVN